MTKSLERAEATERQHERMLKGWLLIQAALATDRTAASLDDDVKTLFAAASQRLAGLKSIVWGNPDRPEEDPIAWLEGGGKPEPRRELGWAG